MKATSSTSPVRVPIRDAASVVVVDLAGDEPRVLAGLRASGHVFMANRLVFPGGRVDKSDLRLASAFRMPPEIDERLRRNVGARFDDRRVCALALAAIRETFEETGAMLGRSAPGFIGTAPFWRDFAAKGVMPEPQCLVPFARAITPPQNVRRYDTRFFAVSADAICHQVPFEQRPTDEFTTVRWWRLSEMAAVDLAPITRRVLNDLIDRFDRGTLFNPQAPIPFYRLERGRFVRDML